MDIFSMILSRVFDSSIEKKSLPGLIMPVFFCQIFYFIIWYFLGNVCYTMKEVIL